ncbi:MAG TPA: ATP-grasp domain-containing protein [Gaiellaceae bacterium]|nr:ATP-grasp domain-containing protein [Gaiellaceae bacterium]
MAGERILCCVDESTGSLAAVRGLRAAGYEPWVAVSRPHAYAVQSRAVEGVVRLSPPKEDPATYAGELAREALRLEADVVLPCTEPTMRALTGREMLFERAVVGVCSPEHLDRATDKALFSRLCVEAGLDIPPTVEVGGDSLNGLDQNLPGVLKPIRSVDVGDNGSLRTGGARMIVDLEDLKRELARKPHQKFLLQPYFDGTLAAICGVAWRGKLVCACHQVSPRIWPPGCGNSSFAFTVERDEGREAGVTRVLELLDWSGIFGVQFILAHGRAFAIDLNPRIYGSAALAIAAGHNLPAIWVDLLLGRPPRVGPYRSDVRYRYEVADLRALSTQLLRGGDRPAVLRGFLPRRRTVHAVFSLRDPLPMLENVRRIPSAISSRARRRRVEAKP